MEEGLAVRSRTAEWWNSVMVRETASDDEGMMGQVKVTRVMGNEGIN